jgi:SnoaL-like domain
VSDLGDIEARLSRLEDESAIQRLLMSYGPAADAGLSGFAAALWLEDGEYDWDADGETHRGSSAVDTMLQSDSHRQLISEGVAHFGGPLLVEVDGDQASAVNYSLIMRRDEQRFYLWRVSAVRWDLGRFGSTWRVRRRTNRLLDESGAGSRLFGAAIGELFPEGPK